MVDSKAYFRIILLCSNKIQQSRLFDRVFISKLWKLIVKPFVKHFSQYILCQSSFTENERKLHFGKKKKKKKDVLLQDGELKRSLKRDQDDSKKTR